MYILLWTSHPIQFVWSWNQQAVTPHQVEFILRKLKSCVIRKSEEWKLEKHEVEMALVVIRQSELRLCPHHKTVAIITRMCWCNTSYTNLIWTNDFYENSSLIHVYWLLYDQPDSELKSGIAGIHTPENFCVMSWRANGCLQDWKSFALRAVALYIMVANWNVDGENDTRSSNPYANDNAEWG